MRCFGSVLSQIGISKVNVKVTVGVLLLDSRVRLLRRRWLWISGAAGSQRWRHAGRSLQIPVWQRGSSTLSGEPLHLQLPESKAWAPTTHSIISDKLWTLGGMLRPPCGLEGEHLTHCCPLILTSSLPVTPAASPAPLHQHPCWRNEARFRYQLFLVEWLRFFYYSNKTYDWKVKEGKYKVWVL